MSSLEILTNPGEGYKRLVNGPLWTVATINWAPRFDAANFAQLERHLLTDETFVLLAGSATLLVGETAERVEMEPGLIYNVKAGVWHHIFVSRDASVLVAENADTSRANSEYLPAPATPPAPEPRFEEILPGTFLLRVPFGPVWTGIILVRGADGKNFLIDSSHLEPEQYLVPALAALDLAPRDISWLLCTHVHGDHIGGHHALHTRYGVKVATPAACADALRDPVAVAIRVRTRFPENSPPPQTSLKGVEPDRLLTDGELLEGRFRAIPAPGHDDDCLVWLDTATGTAFTGDSLQGNGTASQGIAFYRDLPAYRATLARLAAEPIENIVCAHDYDGIGSVIRGREAVAAALRYSASRVALYGEKIAEHADLSEGVTESAIAALARLLIAEVGCGMPEKLFLAMHTVDEHLKEVSARAKPSPAVAASPSSSSSASSLPLRNAGAPHWVGVRTAGDFLGLPDRTILHAGPPIEYGRMCAGHRRGMVSACLFEGWAKSPEEAGRLLERGEISLRPACDYATNGSGYGIVTRSVPLLIVEDRETGGAAGVFPSEGRFGGGFCGWGVYSPEIAENLRWMRDTLFPPISAILADCGGFPLRTLFDEALRMGDELHSSQRAIDPLFTRAIAPLALKCANSDALLEYFATANRFTHNFGQAASRALLLGLEARGERGFLTAAGGNGVEFGVKFAGETRWRTAPAPMIEGSYLTPGARRENQLPWLGDSSVVECRGWGGLVRPVNPSFAPGPDWRAIGVEAVRATGIAPVINGGMMDKDGGWMGAGSARIPLQCFA